MREISIVFSILLITLIGFGTVSATENASLYPGIGSAPIEVLTNMYPVIKDNSQIIEYIHECGVGSWYEKQMNTAFKSIHVTPANSCGKQLVLSMRKSGGRDDPTRLTEVWIIEVNETWSSSTDPVYPIKGAYPTLGILGKARNIPPFFVAGVAIGLALIVILFALIRCEK
jgi:hypothetical protein